MRRAQARLCTAVRAGAFPADAAEALSIYGRILPSDATAVSGQIPGIPSPALPGRAAAPGKGLGFSQAGVCPGPESPKAGSRASAVGGLRSWAPGATPEPPSGWRPDPAAPTQSDLIRAGGCCSPCVVAAVVPLPPRKGGSCLPVSPPGARPGARRLLYLVLPGWLLRLPGAADALAWAPLAQLGRVGDGLVRLGGRGSGWSRSGKTPEQPRKNTGRETRPRVRWAEQTVH